MSLSNGSISATWTFDHYADGKIQKVTDSQSPIFDRAFDYDHLGRLQEVRTGSEARGGSTPDGRFKQTYTYDVWENTIARSYRIWSGSMQSDSATFTNNRRQYWSYDNEGNLEANFNASYGYDAAGRQNHFSANAYVGGWPTPHPQEPMMEILQTFDGDSTPVKKTTITRSEYYAGEDVEIQEDTTHFYYLRSSVLGKIIAELDQTGYKRRGYVFAGGMQIATQSVWNPGYGYDVSLTTTSPATGSEYMLVGLP